MGQKVFSRGIFLEGSETLRKKPSIPDTPRARVQPTLGRSTECIVLMKA